MVDNELDVAEQGSDYELDWTKLRLDWIGGVS